MPSVTFTLSDTPGGAVAVHTDFAPAIGAPVSPAQAAALEVISRTRAHYGLDTLPGAVDRQLKPRDLIRRGPVGSGL